MYLELVRCVLEYCVVRADGRIFMFVYQSAGVLNKENTRKTAFILSIWSPVAPVRRICLHAAKGSAKRVALEA